MGAAKGKLKYAGRGQIVRVSDGALVSPRWLVEAYNDLLDISEDFKNTLKKALDALTYAKQQEAQ